MGNRMQMSLGLAGRHPPSGSSTFQGVVPARISATVAATSSDSARRNSAAVIAAGMGSAPRIATEGPVLSLPRRCEDNGTYSGWLLVGRDDQLGEDVVDPSDDRFGSAEIDRQGGMFTEVFAGREV